MAATFAGGGRALCASTLCPRNSMWQTPNWYLAGLRTRSCCCKRSKSWPMLSLVLGPVASGHQNIKKVNKHTVKAPAYSVYEVVDYLHSHLEPKWHPQKFIQVKRCNYGCFWDVCCCYRNLVSTDEIDL